MRLSDFENEEAIDLLAEIIDPAVDIMSDADIVNIVRSGKPSILAVKKALKDHKQAVVSMVAILHRKTPETVKFTLPTLIKDLLDMFNDPEIKAVFRLGSPEKQSESSGSATETTEDQGK